MRLKNKTTVIVLLTCIIALCSANVTAEKNQLNYNIGWIELHNDTIYLNNDLLLWYSYQEEKKSISIPEFIGFEKSSLKRCYNDEFILKYSSSHVSVIYLFLTIDSLYEFQLNHIALVSPCQTCDPLKISTFEKDLNVGLVDVLKTNYLEEIIDNEFRYNSHLQRNFIESETGTELNKLYCYTKKIRKIETSVSCKQLKLLLKHTPIHNTNVSKYNDIAYFLGNGNSFEQSILILKEIINEFPNRTVAYINLGDAYWGLEEKENASQAYKKYIELMKVNCKENKIPQRVFDRIKQLPK